MFKIIKKGSNNFWHVFNNGAKNVSISDFEVVLDDVLNTFVIVLRNGANIPQIALSVLDIIVIDETTSSFEETFLTASQLRARLVQLNYTAYISGGTNELSQLTDVDVNGLTNGQVLVWNSTTNKWTATTIGGLTTPTLQEVTAEGNYSPLDIQIDIAEGSQLKFVDGQDNIISSIYGINGNFNFVDNAGTGNSFSTDSTELSSGSKILATREWTSSQIPTTATDLDALKRDGSNANSDVDLGAFRIRASEVVTQKGGDPSKSMALKGSNLDAEYTAEWQPKNYTAIADMPDITDALATFKTANYLDFTSSGQGQLNSKQDALGFTPDKPTSLMSLNADYTGTTSTSLQKAFNVGSSGNGSFPAVANKKYAFEYILYLDNLSSTSGTISFGILGTATIDFIFGNSVAKKTGTPSNAASSQSALINSTTQAVVTATTTTNGYFCIIGELTTTSSGTLIPAFAVSQSTTPTIKKGSFFRIKELGANTLNATSDIV